MGIARKIRKEYSKAQQIVEQATSSIRTVYSFVGEKKTFSEYSVALRPTVQLGIRQGIAKGLAVGSSSIGLALWSFIAYYGSRLVMYHGAKGGTIYAVAAALTLGNISKGARNSSSFRKSSCPDSSVVPSSSEDHQIGGNKPSLKRLFAMNLPEWRQALLGCVSAILCGAVQPSFAYTMGTTMSAFFLTDHGEIKRKTRIYSFVFLGLALLSLLINVSQHYNFAAMGEYLTQRVRERMLSKILTFEIGWFDEEGNATGVICSRLARDANVVRSLVGDRMSLLVQAISSVTIACTIGLIISWRLALAMMAIQPLVVGIFYSKHTLLKTMSKKATESQNTSSKIAAEAVSNVRTVAAFNSQPQMLQMLKKAQQGSKGESIRQSWLAGIGLGVSNCLLLLVWPFAFWFGGRNNDK
ncbi:OLC1v1014942C1 [Oldenlandia corymbosa var. corymbosa]|uniref:OLC1v1014942C1 n=1 Tax=Oldenlandia corymbosa var. corymbosa TaxID=529605 RepID=A0AAV1E227_OLDCO|nr:OLC1v1014942C1 [Oldenlandia corymbosa var. corymbosa]